MLKYNIKPIKKITLSSFPIRELRVTSDLSQISGVTDYNVGLVNGEEVIIKSPYLFGDEANTINSFNVVRQGKVGINLSLPIKTVSKQFKFYIMHDSSNRSYIIINNNVKYVNDNADGYIFETVTQKYVEYNGDISYFFSGSSSDYCGYLIDGKFYKTSYQSDTVDVNSYINIENNKFTIGNNIYNVDFSVPDRIPTIKLDGDVNPISGGSYLGELDGNPCSAATDSSYAQSDKVVLIKDYDKSKWEYITHFSLTKHENPVINIEDALFGGYKHFITYKGKNYYLEDVYDDGEYKGYGAVIDDTFYPMDYNYIDEEVYNIHKDIAFFGCYVYVENGEVGENSGTTLEVNDLLYASHEAGKFIMLINTQEHDDIAIGNIIEANSYYPISIRKQVEEVNGEKFITYNGEKYFVKSHIYDTITVSDKEYQIHYIDDNTGYYEVNGGRIYLNIDNYEKATYKDKIYYESNVTSEGKVLVKYGNSDKEYNIKSQSGITINNINYPVIEDKNVINGQEETIYYVNIASSVSFELEVTDINGASTYLCYPVCDDNELDVVQTDELQREICTIIIDNWKSFEFSLKKNTFGDKIITPENGIFESTISDKPYTITNDNSLEKNIEILRVQNYLSFKFPIMSKIETNIKREDVIKNDFVDFIKERSINNIVDMEKDIYYPVWKDNDKYKPINELVFNLHFRTRNLDNWKVIEDDREFSGETTPNSVISNWFVTDYKYYNNVDGDVLQNTSDLLGLVNFTTSEIRNNAKKISRSFLRLSYYTTDNPNTQNLLYTSTIFFDENNAFNKYMSLKRAAGLVFTDVSIFQDSPCSGINDPSTACTDKEKSKITSYTSSSLSELYGDDFLNDGLRMSSRFKVVDKYNTSTSSDGYYLYLFKEYAKKMHETTIYLKIEFNHAGIGKSIQFSLPRKEDGKLYRLKSSNDVSEMKLGFNMQDIYKQTYIPINVVYDDNENRYVYYLPSDLREQNYLTSDSKIQLDDNIMVFNLFETKFANEAIVNVQNEGN